MADSGSVTIRRKRLDSNSSHDRFAHSFPSKMEEQGYIDVVMETRKRCKEELHKIEKEIEDGLTHVELSSDVSSGYAGVSLYYLRRSYQEQDEKEKQRYLEKAKQYSDKSIRRKLPSHLLGFLQGKVGVYVTAAIVEKLTSKSEELTSKAKEYIYNVTDKLESILTKNYENETFYGRAGYLYSLLILNEYFPDKPASKDMIERLVTKIIDEGVEYGKSILNSEAMIWPWHDKSYLGGAHGASGVIHILLLASDYLSAEQKKLVLATVHYCIKSYQIPIGQFISSINSKNEKLVQWCHGCPSWVMLLSEILAKFDASVEEPLIRASVFAWKEGLSIKGLNLCHGISGNAFTLLHAYQYTKQIKYLYMASQFANAVHHKNVKDTLTRNEPTSPEFYSLLTGELGHALFLSELAYMDEIDTRCFFPGWTLSFSQQLSQPDAPLVNLCFH